MKKFLFLTVVLFMTSTYAADLSDVKVLDILEERETIKLKLQAASAAKDSYFYVAVTPDDKNASSKMALVQKKMKLKEKFTLSLVIPSFSARPNGSYYRSKSVTFKASAEGESKLGE